MTRWLDRGEFTAAYTTNSNNLNFGKRMAKDTDFLDAVNLMQTTTTCLQKVLMN